MDLHDTLHSEADRLARQARLRPCHIDVAPYEYHVVHNAPNSDQVAVVSTGRTGEAKATTVAN
jgi:hypothetical protein